MNNNEKFAELIKNKSNLPILFCVNNDEICGDYSNSVFTDYTFDEITVYETEEGEYFTHEVDAFEYLQDNIYDGVGEELSDEEWDKFIYSKFDENFHIFQAIMVYVR